ncbi:hypothetical protein EVJ58_g4073 [Rhodofomes roseus]|uniref:Uncharacterized protein n=1 Tax=Rhodofomes roseus TaxID=34475 RepID=A0A4Y9YJE2_9APHY|nr:hypothetical protein EVJ58_g4073 [Rhodofomes roseus]
MAGSGKTREKVGEGRGETGVQLGALFDPERHVKALESRSQLLDAALASADEANRRWEECRALVDSLRIEINTLRGHISALQEENGKLRDALGPNAPEAAGVAPSVTMSAPAPDQSGGENRINGERDGSTATREGEKDR